MSEEIILNMDTPSIQYLCKKDKHLAALITMIGPITYHLHDENEYAFLIHEIIEQMLSVKAAIKIYNRLEELCSGKITPERVAILTDNQIKSIGTSNAKVIYIRGVTNAVISGKLDFVKLATMSNEDISKELISLRGIGTWTVKMYLMFVLDRPDIPPVEDVAFLHAYKWLYKTGDCSTKAVEKKCRKWSPYSTTASRFLYRALDMGVTKTEFRLI